MPTSFVNSDDGTRIAYEVTGSGPAIILLHGGGQHRVAWHEAGYVDKLKNSHELIAIDIRGYGESDRPAESSAHGIDFICQDILAVADACEVQHFSILGFSLGGNIGRYVAASSPRVHKLIMMGGVFGPGASGEARETIKQTLEAWLPVVRLKLAGKFDPARLPPEAREAMETVDIVPMIALLQGMLDWRAVEPEDVQCPTLWLSGSKHQMALDNMQEREGRLVNTKVETIVVDGLTHEEEFTNIDAVLPAMLAFMNRSD